MDKTKEQIQEFFNIFDKDGSGAIDKEEIKALALNVGLNWNDQKLNTIISALDTNGDGKISFDEFYEYFLYGEQKQMDKLIRMKFKHVKNVKNLHKKLSQEYAQIFQKNNEEGKQKCQVQLNVGDKHQSKSSLDVTVRAGEENVNFSQSLLKNFPYVGDQIVSVVLGFKCQNSDTVQEKFQAFFEGIIDLALNMIPDEVSGKLAHFKDDLKIEYKALPEELLIRFYVHNEFTENILMAYRLISGMFLSENSSFFANLKLSFVAGLADIGASPNENVVNWLGKGFQASFEGQATQDLVEFSRQGHYAAIGKYFDSGKVKALELLTPLVLLKNVRLQFNFDSYEKFIDEMQLPEFDDINMGLAINQFKGAGITEMIGGIPFISELLDTLRLEGGGSLQIAVISQEVSLNITASGEGAALIWEKLL